MSLNNLVNNSRLHRYKIAYLKGFKETPLLKKTIDFLRNGNFISAESKKLVNTNYFRAKINYEDRLVFTFISHKNEKYILLLEVIYAHRYEKSRFLNNVYFTEEEIITEEVNTLHVDYMNEEREFFYTDKFLSFSPKQKELLTVELPLIVVGSAGSGKTSVTVEKLKNLQGKILYTSLSSYLVSKTEEVCEGEKNIDFLTFKEVLNRVEKQKCKQVSFRDFKLWAYWHKIKELEKYYEEFNGVLTASHERVYLSKLEYLELGVKQSLFSKEERIKVYHFFQKYLEWLADKSFYNSNIVAFELLAKVKKKYDFLVIDEIQDFTNIQIFFLLKSLKNPENFIFAGDSNQILYANFFSWTNLKSMLIKETKESQIQILKDNYRNSKQITTLANQLLKVKQLRFGSIDKESNYLSDTSSSIEGEIHFIRENKQVLKELNRETKASVDFAIIVLNEKMKKKVLSYFETPLIFTIEEAKGLEYKNVILINFVSSNASKFHNMVSAISKIDIAESLEYGRQKDKENKELETYKVYINSLYVAFTRAIENLYIIESKHHKLFEILGLVAEKKEKISVKKSSRLAWEKEAEKLRKLNKLSQSNKIVTKKLESVSPIKENKKKFSPKVKKVHKVKMLQKSKTEPTLSTLIEKVFNVEKASKSDKDKLFKMAKQKKHMLIIKRLNDDLQFKAAKLYLKALEKPKVKRTVLKNPFAMDMSSISLATVMGFDSNYMEIKEAIKNNANPNLRDAEGRTALMIAVEKNKSSIVKLILDCNVDSKEKHLGKTALDMAIEKGDKKIIELLKAY